MLDPEEFNITFYNQDSGVEFVHVAKGTSQYAKAKEFLTLNLGEQSTKLNEGQQSRDVFIITTDKYRKFCAFLKD